MTLDEAVGGKIMKNAGFSSSNSDDTIAHEGNAFSTLSCNDDKYFYNGNV